MKKIIIANNVSLSSHRPWQREDEDYFSAALERFIFVCETAKKQKAGLVLTGHALGRLTNPQMIQVIKELPNDTVIVTDKVTPLLNAMDKAGFLRTVTPGSPYIDKDSIQLAYKQNDEELCGELDVPNTIVFSDILPKLSNAGATFVMSDVNTPQTDKLSLPNAIRLFPGDEHKAVIQMVKTSTKGMSLETIETPFNDESFLSKVTEKTDQITQSLAMTQHGATSGFATLLKEHGDKMASGDVIDIVDIVNETPSGDESLDVYIKELHAEAKLSLSA
jgi:hypothetical protein